MVDRELFQNRGGSPKRRGGNREKRSGSVQQQAQRCEQPGSCFLDVEEVGTQKHHRHAGGLAQTRGFTQRWPGEEQGEGRIEGEQGTHQRGVSPRKSEGGKQGGGPIQEGRGQ